MSRFVSENTGFDTSSHGGFCEQIYEKERGFQCESVLLSMQRVLGTVIYVAIALAPIFTLHSQVEAQGLCSLNTAAVATEKVGQLVENPSQTGDLAFGTQTLQVGSYVYTTDPDSRKVFKLSADALEEFHSVTAPLCGNVNVYQGSPQGSSSSTLGKALESYTVNNEDYLVVSDTDQQKLALFDISAANLTLVREIQAPTSSQCGGIGTSCSPVDFGRSMKVLTLGVQQYLAVSATKTPWSVPGTGITVDEGPGTIFLYPLSNLHDTQNNPNPAPIAEITAEAAMNGVTTTLTGAHNIFDPTQPLYFGYSMDAIDIDGDGSDELIVGAPGTFDPKDTSGPGKGMAYVVEVALNTNGSISHTQGVANVLKTHQLKNAVFIADDNPQQPTGNTDTDSFGYVVRGVRDDQSGRVFVAVSAPTKVGRVYGNPSVPAGTERDNAGGVALYQMLSSESPTWGLFEPVNLYTNRDAANAFAGWHFDLALKTFSDTSMKALEIMTLVRAGFYDDAGITVARLAALLHSNGTTTFYKNDEAAVSFLNKPDLICIQPGIPCGTWVLGDQSSIRVVSNAAVDSNGDGKSEYVLANHDQKRSALNTYRGPTEFNAPNPYWQVIRGQSACIWDDAGDHPTNMQDTYSPPTAPSPVGLNMFANSLGGPPVSGQPLFVEVFVIDYYATTCGNNRFANLGSKTPEVYLRSGMPGQTGNISQADCPYNGTDYFANPGRDSLALTFSGPFQCNPANPTVASVIIDVSFVLPPWLSTIGSIPFTVEFIAQSNDGWLLNGAAVQGQF